MASRTFTTIDAFYKCPVLVAKYRTHAEAMKVEAIAIGLRRIAAALQRAHDQRPENFALTPVEAHA